MNKPTLLYASPFPPKESGISDYSVILVNALSTKFDITLYTDNYEITEPAVSGYPVLKHGADKIDFKAFDYILYNMGNNSMFHTYIYEAALEHPGVIIQHDLVLFNFIFGYYKEIKNIYFSSIYKKFGIDDFTSIKEAFIDGKIDLALASRLPLNTEILRSGNRFIAHSEYTRQKMIGSGYISEKNVCHINLIEQVSRDAELIDKDKLFKKFNVPMDAIVVCSFGYIQSTKLNRETCVAVKKIAKLLNRKICYVMVGQGEYANDLLEEGFIIKTGYSELDEFNSFIKYADVIVNLRFPSMGETSAAMLRILQMGKPCITNNGGWFSEIPDNCVRKIELDNIEKNLLDAMLELISDNELREQIGKNARKYVDDECSAEVISQKMYDFITSDTER